MEKMKVVNMSDYLQDDGFPTETSEDQGETLESVLEMLLEHPTDVTLERSTHIKYLFKPLNPPSAKTQEGLSEYFVSLDASRPWILYWILHSLDLLGRSVPDSLVQRVIDTVASFQNLETGGFGGGPGQLSHLAPTYACINVLAILNVPEAYVVLDRPLLYKWMLSLKETDGSFHMHLGGEIDVRGSYCALSVASLLNMITPELTQSMGSFITACQSYEGGIGGEPGIEAHGGYSYCGLAALCLLKHHGFDQSLALFNVDSLLEWTCHRQMTIEGGFQGRTNKLVDACYSLWQGGVFPLLECYFSRELRLPEDRKTQLWDRKRLQEYLLVCCQGKFGGIRDKPVKRPDFYHTCYGLSGLSVAQHKYAWTPGQEIKVCDSSAVVFGVPENIVAPTHPVHNIRIGHVQDIKAHFYKLPVPI